MLAPVMTACAGFLVAVLWIDLMFDSLVPGPGEVPGPAALAAVTGYYHRATTTSQPRGALIATVMAALLVSLGVEALIGDSPGWLLAVSAPAAGGPILLALLRTVPNAVKLGRHAGSPGEQSRLARAIRRDHRLCLAGIATFLALWLWEALR